jgi:hypothetical protein
MTAEEIKQAINQGFRVYWANKSYEVTKGKGALAAEYLIKSDNGTCVGLTWCDGVTLNGDPKKFFTCLPDTTTPTTAKS